MADVKYTDFSDGIGDRVRIEDKAPPAPAQIGPEQNPWAKPAAILLAEGSVCWLLVVLGTPPVILVSIGIVFLVILGRAVSVALD